MNQLNCIDFNSYKVDLILLNQTRIFLKLLPKEVKSLISQEIIKSLLQVFLIGLKENPYLFIKSAKTYVQPSRYEGKSIAIDEAKILGKPIVVTNFSTAKDQIISNKNGIIVDMNADALATTIANVLKDTNLQNTLKENLAKEKLGTASEINKFYELVNE